MPLGNYFDVEKDMMQVGGEFLLVRDEESNFYFLCTDDCDIEILCRVYDWYIVSSGRFNDRLRIGMGLAGEDAYGSEMFRVKDEQTLRLWHDMLKFTFKGDFIRSYYPMTNRFRGKLRVDGALCFYIHDYHPVSHKLKLTSEQKKVTNLVFRFKEGVCASLAAKLFSLAISRMEFFNGLADPDTSSSFHEREAPAAFRVLLRGAFPPSDNRQRFFCRPDRARPGAAERHTTKEYVRRSLRPGLYRRARRFANRRYSDYRYELCAHKTRT